jgi:hypothetical protein
MTRGDDIVIAWIDLVTHCSNMDFSNMAILPTQKPVHLRDSQENSCYFLADGLIPGIHGTQA